MINIAQAWLLPVAADSSGDDSTAVSAAADAAAFFRMPRDLFE